MVETIDLVFRCVQWSKSRLAEPKGHPHGIKNRWYIFPLNYDPTWMLEQCPAFSTEKDISQKSAE